ncbi:hypothetical protein EV356DRAFT_505389 [Viridothelium virens]|uniref:Putative gamma-glutamylcyclotransferase n=1 Tax=Viridothelium virens TaxID=1048519 RepID=A0A6A6H3Y6_VIRVR|nr:hypothetical protein EV356DRAFT_505389 [Viridothelium virens]
MTSTATAADLSSRKKPGESPTHTAFFYGTLMSPAILQRVIQNPSIALPSSHTTASPALLPGFRRHRVRHADYPAILPSKDRGACVRGTLVRGLSAADMVRLDYFEGTEYERRVVSVRVVEEGEKGEEEARDQGQGQAGKKGKEGKKKEKGEEDEEDEEDEATMVRAETYVWIAGRKQLEDREWDFEEFRREKMWRWTGRESSEYRDVEKLDESGGGNGEVDPTRGRGPEGEIGKGLERDSEKTEEVLESAV